MSKTQIEYESILREGLEKDGYEVERQVRFGRTVVDLVAKKDGKTSVIEFKSSKRKILTFLAQRNRLIREPGIDFVYVAAPMPVIEEDVQIFAAELRVGLLGIDERGVKQVVGAPQIPPAKIMGGGGYPSSVYPGQIFDVHFHPRNSGEKTIRKIQFECIPVSPLRMAPREKRRKIIRELQPEREVSIEFKIRILSDAKPGEYPLFYKMNGEGLKLDASFYPIRVTSSPEEEIVRSASNLIQTLDDSLSSIAKMLQQIDEAVMNDRLDAKQHVIDKSIWNTLGKFCTDKGLFRQAELVYRKMLETLTKYDEKHKGENPIHKGLAFHNLGVALYNQGKREEAKTCFTKAFEEDKRTYSPEDAEKGLAKKALDTLVFS